MVLETKLITALIAQDYVNDVEHVVGREVAPAFRLHRSTKGLTVFTYHGQGLGSKHKSALSWSGVDFSSGL
jgi:hypothetical protein